MTSGAFGTSLKIALRHPLWRRLLVGNVVLFVLMILVATFVWWPAERELDQLQGSIESKRQELVTRLQAGEIVEAYRTSLNTAPILEKKLAATVSQSELIQRLARLAAQKTLKVVAQSFDRGPEGQAVGDIQVLEMTVSGDYRGVRGFLNGLSELPVVIEVTEMRLERGRERGGAALQAQIRLAVYRKAGSQEGGART